MTLEELLSIQEDQLMLTQERNTLIKEHKEIKIKYDELKYQCIMTLEDLSSIQEA